jgi:hypothetical protein
VIAAGIAWSETGGTIADGAIATGIEDGATGTGIAAVDGTAVAPIATSSAV